MLRNQNLILAVVVLWTAIAQSQEVNAGMKMENRAFPQDLSDFNGMTSFKLRTVGSASSGNSGGAMTTVQPSQTQNNDRNGANGNGRRNKQSSKMDASNSMGEIDEANKQAKLLLNAKRKDHGTQPLHFCPTTRSLAEECANTYVQFQASTKNKPHLRNLGNCYDRAISSDTAVYFYETTNKQEIVAVSEAVKDWYEEVDATENDYDYVNPVKATLHEYQHKTQIIWNNTQAFGSACSQVVLGPVQTTTTMASASTSGSGSAAGNSSTKKEKDQKLYICSFAFCPGGNIRRRFGEEELDEYRKNVPAPTDS